MSYKRRLDEIEQRTSGRVTQATDNEPMTPDEMATCILAPFQFNDLVWDGKHCQPRPYTSKKTQTLSIMNYINETLTATPGLIFIPLSVSQVSLALDAIALNLLAIRVVRRGNGEIHSQGIGLGRLPEGYTVWNAFSRFFHIAALVEQAITAYEQQAGRMVSMTIEAIEMWLTDLEKNRLKHPHYPELFYLEVVTNE